LAATDSQGGSALVRSKRQTPAELRDRSLSTSLRHDQEKRMAPRRRCAVTALALVANCTIAASTKATPLAPRRRTQIPYEVSCAAAGAVSTCVSHTATLPLDVLKTKIQSDAAFAGLGLAAVAKRVVRTQGPRALLAGFTPNALGYFAQGAIKFGLYETGKRCLLSQIRRRKGDAFARKYRVGAWAAAATGAEVAACLALCPMEATKIRLVTDPFYARSTFGALRRIVAEGGARSLWQGVGPIMVRQVPYTVAKLAGYELLCARTATQGVVPGVLAGGAAAVVSQPGDVVLMRLCGGSAKARLTGQCSLEAGTSVAAVLDAVTHPSELFVGLQARAAMCALICASQFFLYEALRPHPRGQHT